MRRRGRWFFTGIAAAAGATVLVGFARTYYIKQIFAAPSLPPLFHLHGALFTAWMLLFIIQACLVATRRTWVHRRLGIVGGLLVMPMVASGISVAITAARGEGPVSSAVARGEFVQALPDLPPLVAMVIPLTSVLLFAMFAGAGLVYRRQPDVHKRLMGTRNHRDATPGARSRVVRGRRRVPSSTVLWRHNVVSWRHRHSRLADQRSRAPGLLMGRTISSAVLSRPTGAWKYGYVADLGGLVDPLRSCCMVDGGVGIEASSRRRLTHQMEPSRPPPDGTMWPQRAALVWNVTPYGVPIPVQAGNRTLVECGICEGVQGRAA